MKKKVLIIAVIGLLGIGGLIWWKNRQKTKQKNLAGFNPEPSATTLYVAMKGMGTDEDAIFNTLSQLNKDQRQQVIKFFNENYGEKRTFHEWLEKELNKSDFNKAIKILKS